MSKLLFASFEIALLKFPSAGGADVMSIRSSGAVFYEFRRTFSSTTYMGIPVRLARAQCNVSIRGPSLTGEAFGFPAPEAGHLRQ
jgi:hypothetical protein